VDEIHITKSMLPARPRPYQGGGGGGGGNRLGELLSPHTPTATATATVTITITVSINITSYNEPERRRTRRRRRRRENGCGWLAGWHGLVRLGRRTPLLTKTHVLLLLLTLNENARHGCL